MKKNIEILINNKTIEVHFNKELKNHKIILKFEIVNSYQLICMNYEIISKNSIELSSTCLLYTSPSPRDGLLSRMPSSA